MTTIATKYPFVGCVDTRQGGRKENQDNAGFVDTPLGLLLVVCDGMGGGPGGRTASLMAVDTLLTVLSDVSEHTPREDALKFAINKANDIIYAKAKEKSELRGMGTTIAAILINETSAVIAHAGDTRVYQLRKGVIVYRSSDHSVVANLVRQKKITEEEARNHPQSNIVTRAIGIRPSMEIEFDEVSFLRGDRFVVCTDGIWGMMPQRDLVKSLSRVMGISELTTLMTEEIDKMGQDKGGGHDNLTLAVIDMSFDSSLQKIKKKHNIDILTLSNKKGNGLPNKMGCIFLIILICITAIIFLFLYLNNPRQDEDNIKNRHKNLLKGETTTTIDNRIVRIKEGDSVSEDINNIEYHVHPLSKEGVENPFNDRKVKDEHKIEIARQINRVVKNLDSLKKINGKNREGAQKNKRRFVKYVIEPDINRLGNEVKEKKKNIGVILKMLNNKKTISSTKNGQSTKEGIKHIDKIKTEMKGLQN